MSQESTAALIIPEEKKDEQPVFSFNAEALIRTAIENKVDVSTMERLLEMRRQLKAEHAVELFNLALAAFQSECPVITKTKEVKTKTGIVAYRYAPLESIVTQVKDLLRKHGFSYSIEQELLETGVKIVCNVVHRDGHTKSFSMQVPFGGKTEIMNMSQVAAAASTFAKRYAFCNAFGILTGDEDTDGRLEDNVPVAEEVFDPATSKISFGKHKDTIYKDLPKDYLNWMVENAKPAEKEKAKKTLEYIKNPPAKPAAAKPAAPAPVAAAAEIPFSAPPDNSSEPAASPIPNNEDLISKGLAEPGETAMEHIKKSTDEKALMEWCALQTHCNKNQKFRQAVLEQVNFINANYGDKKKALPWLSADEFKVQLEKINQGDITIFPDLQTKYRIKSFHLTALNEAHEFSLKVAR